MPVARAREKRRNLLGYWVRLDVLMWRLFGVVVLRGHPDVYTLDCDLVPGVFCFVFGGRVRGAVALLLGRDELLENWRGFKIVGIDQDGCRGRMVVKNWRAGVEGGWCLRLMCGKGSELVLDGCAAENLHLWDIGRSSQDFCLLVQLESSSCRVVSLKGELRWNSDVIRGRRTEVTRRRLKRHR